MVELSISMKNQNTQTHHIVYLKKMKQIIQVYYLFTIILSIQIHLSAYSYIILHNNKVEFWAYQIILPTPTLPVANFKITQPIMEVYYIFTRILNIQILQTVLSKIIVQHIQAE